MNDSVRVVLLDAVGTLIHPVPDVGEVYCSAGRRYGSQYDHWQLQTRFVQVFANHNVAGQTSEPSEHARWRNIVTEVFDDVTEAGGSLFDELWAHFANPAHWRVYDDVESTWHGLRERGIRIGIASNFDARLERICRSIRPLGTADHLYVSSHVGYAKPHAEFYAHIQRELRVPAHQILLVGDDLQCDVEAPLAAGWRALWLRRDGHTNGRSSIQQLTELLEQL